MGGAAASDAAETPAAAASDAPKDPQSVEAAPAEAEAEGEDDSEDFALLGLPLVHPTTTLLTQLHPPSQISLIIFGKRFY